MNSKTLIKKLLILLVYILIILPVVLTFNEMLTQVVEKNTLYVLMQKKIVPFEVWLVGMIVKPFVTSYIPVSGGMIVNNIQMAVTWNCLGWQSVLLFMISSLITFLNFKVSNLLKIELIFVGLFGIFWVNILRIVFTVVLAIYSMPVFRIVYHDILSAFVTIVYILIFWRFNYTYIIHPLDNEQKID